MINDEILRKLECLSMLEIVDKDSAKMYLQEVLGFIDNLSELECQELPEFVKQTPLRDDKVHSCNISETVLSSAPKSDDGFFIVPKIIE